MPTSPVKISIPIANEHDVETGRASCSQGDDIADEETAGPIVDAPPTSGPSSEQVAHGAFAIRPTGRDASVSTGNAYDPTAAPGVMGPDAQVDAFLFEQNEEETPVAVFSEAKDVFIDVKSTRVQCVGLLACLVISGAVAGGTYAAINGGGNAYISEELNCTICSDGEPLSEEYLDKIPYSLGRRDGLYSNKTCGEFESDVALLTNATQCAAYQATAGMACGCNTGPDIESACDVCPDGQYFAMEIYVNKAGTSCGILLADGIETGTCTDDKQMFQDECCVIKSVYDTYKSLYRNCKVHNPSRVGDGQCYGGAYNEYNTEECAWDGGDCIVEGFPDCHVNDWPSYYIGDHYCHGGEYNTEECGWDGGDCIELNRKYPNCTVIDGLIGNGECNAGFGLYNTAECGWDGGDCIEYNEFKRLHPNCTDAIATFFRDGWCSSIFNTKECGWDGGDCIEMNSMLERMYPECHVSSSRSVGDSVCDGGEYNTADCGWDGGDCVEFNEKYPDCKVDYPSWIGDGRCHNYNKSNTEECGWDGGDCTEFNKKYPDCRARTPSILGDGECDGGDYMTEECGWDGGDCVDFSKYPNCDVDRPEWIGNGECDGGDYMTEECGWDGGDCAIKDFPDCEVEYPSYIGDGECDWGEYSTEECGWDGGDCI